MLYGPADISDVSMEDAPGFLGLYRYGKELHSHGDAKTSELALAEATLGLFLDSHLSQKYLKKRRAAWEYKIVDYPTSLAVRRVNSLAEIARIQAGKMNSVTE